MASENQQWTIYRIRFAVYYTCYTVLFFTIMHKFYLSVHMALCVLGYWFNLIPPDKKKRNSFLKVSGFFREKEKSEKARERKKESETE